MLSRGSFPHVCVRWPLPSPDVPSFTEEGGKFTEEGLSYPLDLSRIAYCLCWSMDGFGKPRMATTVNGNIASMDKAPTLGVA